MSQRRRASTAHALLSMPQTCITANGIHTCSPAEAVAMHELSIAESILDEVRKQLQKHPGVTPSRVGMRVGAFTAIDADSLSFCFESVVARTPWARLQLDIRCLPARRRCIDCGGDFLVKDYIAICPECSSTNTIAEGGDELDLEYLEVENDGTLAAEV